jgi:hypothetical protein
MNMIRDDNLEESGAASLIAHAAHVDVENFSKSCRLCGSREHPENMIKPCACDGLQKYVHRKCLDAKRCDRNIPRGFRECDVCKYDYWIELKEEEQQILTVGPKRFDCCYNRVKSYQLYFARDSALGILGVHLLLSALAWLIAVMDNGFTRIIPEDCCPQQQWNFYTFDNTNNPQCPGLCGTSVAAGGPLLNLFPGWIAQNTKTAYYLYAVLSLMLIVSIFGVGMLCFMDDEERERRVGSGCSSLFCFCCCADCCDDCCDHESNENNHNGCSGCQLPRCNNCGGGGGEGLLAILVIVLIVVVFFSFFMGFLVIISIVFKGVQNHYHYLQRKQKCKEFVVIDLGSKDLAPDSDGRAFVGPDFDDSDLQKLGLY